MLSLAAPWALILLPLPLLIWRLMPAHRHRVRALRIPFFRQVTAAAALEGRPGATVLARSRLQMIAAIAVWGLIVLALARPERLGAPVVIESAARDIVLAVDISGSMDARDFATPDGAPMQRLEAVKQVLRGFIADRDADRMALIIFGSRAFVQAPFTEDLPSLAGFLDLTQVGMAGPDTALGDAIGLSVRSFEASDVEERLLILLSDGADTSSRMTPMNAAAIAADKGITIFTIGVGTPDAQGADRVDLVALQQIAAATGGRYFYAADQSALQEVYGEIDRLTPRIAETRSFRPSESLGHWPLGLAALIVIATLGLLQAAPARRETP